MKKGRVNIYQAKSHFSGLVKRVKEKRETCVVFRGNEPVADIVPHGSRDKLPAPLKACEGKAIFKGDPIKSSEDFWPGKFR